METTLENCIFCEKALTQAALTAPGMPVCKDCMQGHSQLGNTMGIVPPRSVLWRRLLVILPGMAIGLVAGCVTAVLVLVLINYLAPRMTSMQILFMLISGLLVFVFFTLLWEIIFFSQLQHAGNAEWKSHLMKMLNLEKIVQRAQVTSHLVICSWQKPGWTDFTLPIEAGILLEIAQGFIYCGAKGTRAVIPLTGITAVGTERLKMFPPMTAIRFDLSVPAGLPTTKGQLTPRQVFFAFRDEKSFKTNSEKARTKQQRIQQNIGASRTLENNVEGQTGK
ncbi:MAG TPA: hypothetical protein VHP14_13680 [Anaerolineales bacterium]|nr:hypothetical protein [Anaerolineales bacterium]